jgi:hypothetical protein
MGGADIMKAKSRILILLSWIHDILLLEGVHVFAAAVQNIRGHELSVFLLRGLTMLVSVILSYFIICKCKNLWLFLVFSLAVTWGMWVVSRSIFIGSLTALVFLFRCYVKLKQGEIRRRMRELPGEAGVQESQQAWEVPTLLDSPRMIHCLIFVFLYLGVLSFHRDTLLYLMLGILGAEFCVCLAYVYLESLDQFIQVNIRVANLPVHFMKRIGTAILLSGMTGLILFMLPAVIYHEEPLAQLRFEPLEMGGGEIIYYEEDGGNDPMLEELMKLRAQAKETPKWLRQASEVLSVLALIGIAYLALRLVYAALRRAADAFSDDGDEVVFLRKEDGREGIRRLPRVIVREGRLSPNRKIRRFYKRLIRRTLKERPPGYETPLELEIRAGLYEDGDEKMPKIHELYEKARYGGEQCTREEVATLSCLSR